MTVLTFILLPLHHRIQYLYLYDNFLTSTIPTEIGLLSDQLSIFQSYHNLLSGSLPLELGMLPQIKEILVSGNELSGTLPSTLGGLSELRMLFLSHNPQLSGEAHAIYNLSSLEALDINQTQIAIDNSINSTVLPNIVGAQLEIVMIAIRGRDGSQQPQGRRG